MCYAEIALACIAGKIYTRSRALKYRNSKNLATADPNSRRERGDRKLGGKCAVKVEKITWERNLVQWECVYAQRVCIYVHEVERIRLWSDDCVPTFRVILLTSTAVFSTSARPLMGRINFSQFTDAVKER